ncbi:SAG family member [Eimeria tenella]|uniref:SAG family member n=1 Tax=Eimeria tenella TaxID=5802 RepID=U6L091_EIMTE|nr:LOW QUALITY PROTEIN: SAG family member [Eimeria tenella]CDJ41984.1 SAG family member [Eimeria tenella]|eukprot:XP_013232734.1 LOW QUALITY PROTEIN: SAG family member [Eimeria tenella]
MNTLRTAARLAKFQDASAVTQVLPNYAKAQRVVEVSAETLWKNEICPKIRAGGSPRSGEAATLTGTYAYFPVTNGEKNCNTAVEYWNGGFSLFNKEIPPTYEGANKPSVYNDTAVSFVALYNPQPEPVVSCVFLQCPPSAAPPGTGRRLSSASTTVDAIICLTNPAALKASAAPFKEDEWNKIVQAISGNKGGASPVGPSVALVSAVAIPAFPLF